MTWRLAKSLETLRTEVNAAYPKRSKLSDGTIGDTAHATTPSDHNPNAAGVVTALDLTHDPANGFDAHDLAERLIENPHSNLKYVISNSRIAGEFTDWNWGWYSGINPHSKHIHISVGRGADGSSTTPYDGTETWNVTKGQPMSTISTAEVVALSLAVRGNRPNDQEVKRFVGQDFTQVKVDEMITYYSQQSRIKSLEDALAKSQSTITSVKATKLEPGLYEV